MGSCLRCSSLALMIDFWFLDRDEIWVVYNNSGYHTPGFAPGRHSCMNTDTGVDALSYMYFSFIINGFVSESILTRMNYARGYIKQSLRDTM